MPPYVTLTKASLKQIAAVPGPFSLRATDQLLEFLLKVRDEDNVKRKIFMFPTKEER